VHTVAKLMLFCGASVLATVPSWGASTTIDFEGFTNNAVVGNFYQGDPGGPVFQNAIILQSPNYNFVDYPPHSGTNVAYSGTANNIEVDFSSLVSDVSLFYTSTINGLFIDAYDSSNHLIQQVFGGTNFAINSLLANNVSGIAKVIIHDDGNFFTIDDLSYNTSSSVPEVSSVSLLITVLGGVALPLFRRRRALKSIS
jgi:hypothetical protein